MGLICAGAITVLLPPPPRPRTVHTQRQRLMGAFDEAIAVRPVGEGRYEIRPDERFAIAGAVNGGVLLASMARAVLDTSPHPYPIATSAHFLRAPRPEPAHVEVEWLKHGKVAATARATLVQGGRPMLETTVTTGALGDPDDAGGLSWTGEPPRLPPLEECQDIQDAQGPRAFSGYAKQVDIRLDPATLGWMRGQPSGRPRCAATSSSANPGCRTPTCSRWPWTACRRWCSACAWWAGRLPSS